MIETPPRLYAIADAAALAGRSIPAAVAEMAEAGVRWIQLRLKTPLEDRERLALVEQTARRLEGAAVRLWIDDRADLAVLVDAGGLHLGQRDLPPSAARRVVGPGCAIGFSTHDLEQLGAADAEPHVDVLAFGPIFETASKERPDPVVGLSGLVRARSRTSKPLVAIGGLDAERAVAALAAGADSVALVSAVCQGEVGANCRRLLALLGA
ncbi:MAG TPA: thiamine phosphate synthase [Thermoanaerobaculia bacterium]|nr:thiamine phosphate synthase [Thermoanaerobaculia bacterium]